MFMAMHCKTTKEKKMLRDDEEKEHLDNHSPCHSFLFNLKILFLIFLGIP